MNRKNWECSMLRFVLRMNETLPRPVQRIVLRILLKTKIPDDILGSHVEYGHLKSYIKRLCKKPRRRSIFHQIYVPRLRSILIVTCFFSAFGLISHLPILGECHEVTLSLNALHYQNLIALNAGIAIIIFALLIFTAENLRDDETTDKVRVLLKSTHLFPLVVAVILNFFIFIWGTINILSIIPLGLIGFFTIRALFKLVAILLDKQRYLEERISLLKDRLKSSIYLAIDERLGNNVLLDFFKSHKILLDYNPISTDANDYYHFKTEKEGVIVDIDLDRLKQFGEIVEKEANKNGYSFFEKKPKIENDTSFSGEMPREIKKQYCQHLKDRHLVKSYRETVQHDDILLRVNKIIIKDSGVIKQLEGLARDIFEIRRVNTFTEQIRLELTGIRDQFLAAVDKRHLSRIDVLFKIYKNLAFCFLESLNEYGFKYTLEQAYQEKGNFFGGWNEIKWLVEDLVNVIARSIEVADKKIIKKVISLPFVVAIKALDYNDHYVFQEFIGFGEYLYRTAHRNDNPDINRYIKRKSLLYLQEIAGFYIRNKLRKSPLRSDELFSAKDFAAYFIVVYRSLLRLAYQYDELNDFMEIAQASNSLFSNPYENSNY